MPRSAPRILIFDSGVGGLSIYSAIRKQLPGCELVFASDTAGFPYGIRSEGDLIARVDRVLGVILDACQPDIAVIACNSASTVVLPVIRSRYATPFVGVVPAIKPAAAQTRSGTIGLLATPATISRPYTGKLIADFAASCRVSLLGSSELVYLAERKLRGQVVTPDEVRTIIAPLFHANESPAMDTVVLACTHFPLLIDELVRAAPWPVTWIDSSAAIALRIESLLASRETLVALDDIVHRALFTGNQPVDSGLRRTLSALGLEQLELIDI